MTNSKFGLVFFLTIDYKLPPYSRAPSCALFSVDIPFGYLDLFISSCTIIIGILRPSTHSKLKMALLAWMKRQCLFACDSHSFCVLILKHIACNLLK